MAQRNNAWAQGPPGGKAKKKKGQSSSNLTKETQPVVSKSAEDRFRQAQAKLQESVQKHLDQDFEASSEEEELETSNIYDSVIRNYSQIGGKGEDLSKTQNFLENIFRSDVAICLICIATIKRADQIWSCSSCYGFFHLLCVQRWGKDSIAHQKMAEDERSIASKKQYFWPCPKCRKNYTHESVPQRYECFCRQVLDPPFQPWLVPHSCGNVCGKDLVPSCGHTCLLLCHPGPCPPCPKMVKSRCYCANGGEKMVRCSYKEWSCGQRCSRRLACKKHACQSVCHPGDCPQCDKTSMMACDCGLESRLTPCSKLSWTCSKVCSKPFDCGIHVCDRTCHKGDCGPCPQSLPRTCPCGAEQVLLPCTQDVSTCNGTCGKLLDCGLHSCNQKCHKGSCGACMEFLEKSCRCGLHKKEIACIKEYLCDAKCKGVRDCGVHPCNRKCCNGSCPPCEKICGKTLRCGQHKCGSVCHRGPCYPCEQTKQISCRCGSTVITVPCGTHRKKKNLKCNKLCQIPPECHHPAREQHKCHQGPCPPCHQVCLKPRQCGHPCSLKCHSSVLVNSMPNYKPATPWEVVTAPVEIKELPCPPCEVPVGVWCPGKHEEIFLPCHRAVAQPCGRNCGRTLACSNHKCQLPCHAVTGAADDESAGHECMECGGECEATRQCAHPCPESCHPPPCPDCTVTLKLRCHCGINFTYVKCSEWTSPDLDDETRKSYQSCKNQCPKTYPCGHRCTDNCHDGACLGADMCRKRIKLTCACKRIKKDLVCHLAGSSSPVCDETCKSTKAQLSEKEDKEREERRLLEEKRNKEELEKYEKKLQGGKRHRGKKKIQNDEETRNFLSTKLLIVAGIVFIVSIGTYFILR
ncbi:unnamed protein product [Nesidiocoris tenuis]|uniref:NF-X1-type domain-containing protein n=1 Tax=Nesidiocoris tenuis TaxID=355587 RepID=A0A6H5GYS2_9HEMI|nr:unnamed protein product [Nesidiocoris tenuis]